MLPSLPVEVWERIIDFCAHAAYLNNDRHMLHACILTCRSWVPTGRYHLYSYVDLRTEENFHRFLDTITSNPELGTFVRYLSTGQEGETETSSKARPSSWIFQVPLLLLPLLADLRSIYIWEMPTWNRAAHMHLSQFRSFHTITQLCLMRCKFASCQDLARFLSWLPSLTYLVLDGVGLVSSKNLHVAPHYMHSLPRIRIMVIQSIADANLMRSLVSWPMLASTSELGYMCNQTQTTEYLGTWLRHSISLQSCAIYFPGILGSTTNEVPAGYKSYLKDATSSKYTRSPWYRLLIVTYSASFRVIF